MEPKNDIIDFIKHYKKDIKDVKIIIEGDQVEIKFTAVDGEEDDLDG